jgi:thymidylate synthase (FAD)
MKVTLISKPVLLTVPEEMGSPRHDQLKGRDAQKLIELAGRVCYDSLGKGRNSEEYAKHILETNHGSVMEHAQFTFFITGVSRGLTHELVRHRVGVAISQRSTRYVDESASDWEWHPLIGKYCGADLLNRLDEAKLTCSGLYDEIVTSIQSSLENEGVDKTTARKQARGAARGVLGNALSTELIWSANVRALRHFIGLRGDVAADAEIRGLAVELFKIMVEEVPAYFDSFELFYFTDGVEGVRPKQVSNQ